MTTIRRLPTPLPTSIAELRNGIVQYWNKIANRDDLGGVPGSLVRDAEIKVTELLETGEPPDIITAARVTAEFEYTRQLYS